VQTYYQILGIHNTATSGEVKAAFRHLAKLYHPDKNPDGKDVFGKILTAYEVLIDADRRKQYDLKLKYSSSVSSANDSTAKKRRTDEQELKRRQYYQEHYKKQYEEAKSRASMYSEKKTYNEYKYILFATPLAVALFLFIIKAFDDSTSKKETEKKTVQSEKRPDAKTGDAIYSGYFKNPVYDTSSLRSFTLKNPGPFEAVACLFNRKQKFIRSAYVSTDSLVELLQLPQETLEIRLAVGKTWNALKEIKDPQGFGRFDTLQGYYKIALPFTKNKQELLMDKASLESFEEITEKEFFKMSPN